MKVKELIELLQKQDPESIIVVDGYETGYDELKKIHVIHNLKRLPDNKAYYDGEYDEAPPLTWAQDIVSAVYLPRSS